MINGFVPNFHTIKTGHTRTLTQLLLFASQDDLLGFGIGWHFNTDAGRFEDLVQHRALRTDYVLVLTLLDHKLYCFAVQFLIIVNLIDTFLCSVYCILITSNYYFVFIGLQAERVERERN